MALSSFEFDFEIYLVINIYMYYLICDFKLINNEINDTKIDFLLSIFFVF